MLHDEVLQLESKVYQRLGRMVLTIEVLWIRYIIMGPMCLLILSPCT
jgi:hypothetical protein